MNACGCVCVRPRARVCSSLCVHVSLYFLATSGYQPG